jgi:hypothetical protein
MTVKAQINPKKIAVKWGQIHGKIELCMMEIILRFEINFIKFNVFLIVKFIFVSGLILLSSLHFSV